MLDHLPTMAAKANDMLHDAIEAFIAQDDGASDEIIRKDDEVDELFNQTKKEVAEMLKGSSEDDNIDNAIDLLMISKYLERIADHAVNICEWTQFSKTGAVKNVRIL